MDRRRRLRGVRQRLCHDSCIMSGRGTRRSRSQRSPIASCRGPPRRSPSTGRRANGPVPPGSGTSGRSSVSARPATLQRSTARPDGVRRIRRRGGTGGHEPHGPAPHPHRRG
jgi:hypothetical protein